MDEDGKVGVGHCIYRDPETVITSGKLSFRCIVEIFYAELISAMSRIP